jgi:hypothetical protein
MASRTPRRASRYRLFPLDFLNCWPKTKYLLAGETATYVSPIAPAKAVAEATAKTAHLAVQP